MIGDHKSTASVGCRIDTLRMALRGLGTDPDAEISARRMAGTIRRHAEQEGASLIATLSHAVESAAFEDLPQNLQALISALRATIANRTHAPFTLLLITADAPLAGSLNEALTATGHKVVTTSAASLAHQLIHEHRPAVIIVDTVLAGDDGRVFIHQLRTQPETAAMPIVAIIPRMAPDESSSSLVQEADAYFRKPVDPEEIATFLGTRFRRGHDLSHVSRRDPLSGLLNRAAFVEALESLHTSVGTIEDPLSIALIGIADCEHITTECTDEARDELLRKIASLLSSSLRSTDIIARWSLCEFAAAFPGEDHFGTSCAMEKVLSRMNRLTLTLSSSRTIPIRAYAGCTLLARDEPSMEALARAEGYLFQARLCPASDSTLTLVSDSLPRLERTARIALFVEDKSTEKAIAQMLERFRIEVVPLHQSANTLENLALSSIQMLIVDDSTAGNSAMQLIRAVRESPRLNRLHVVLLATSEASVAAGLELGANDYILKPIAAPSFADRIRRNLSRRLATGNQRPYTVMIVDTSISQLLIAGTVLYHQTGSNVTLCLGFQDALTRFSESPPDALILDFDIPAAALADFLGRLMKLPAANTVRIIAATARADFNESSSPAAGRITGRIHHPYKPATFLEQLRTLLTLPSEIRETESARTPVESEIQRILSRSR